MTVKAECDDYAAFILLFFSKFKCTREHMKGTMGDWYEKSSLWRSARAPFSAQQLWRCRCSAQRSPPLVKLRFMGKINISLTYHRHFKRRLFIIRWHQRHRRGRRGGSGKGPREDYPPPFFCGKEESGTPNLLLPLFNVVMAFGVFHCPISLQQ